jgi:pimeloyl-ACP methyl ester carboxylesterase
VPAQVFFTPSGVRLRRRSRDLGDLNWLLLPGGPGIGSESLHELADTLNVPGSIWMVDLPGDGSNVNPPGAPPDPFSCWPMVLVEAAQALPNAIYVGHSTGGMYLLSTPKVEQQIVGLALVSAAPDARWRGRFIQMTRRHPLPAVDAATAIYKHKRTWAAMRDIAIASAEWSFTTQSLALGRELLGRMPYNGLAIAWSARNFDETYTSAWWPQTIPTLIVSGADDRIVWQGAWEEPRFQGGNVMHRTIQSGAHFPWIENPQSVQQAFGELAAKVIARPAKE